MFAAEGISSQQPRLSSVCPDASQAGRAQLPLLAALGSIPKVPPVKEPLTDTEPWDSGEEKEFSVFSISHSIGIDSKHSFGLGKTRRVVDFTDPGLTSAFPQVQPDREMEGNRSGWTPRKSS